jgi:predicted amidohydrolase
MIVAGLQMDIAWEDPSTNFRHVEEMARQAAEQGPRLLVLPEMFATGFSMSSHRVAAFSQETRAFLAHLATDLSVFVLGGYAEPAQPLPANACSIFSPQGEEILHYRKLHPFSLAKEHENYIGGDTVSTATVEGIRVTPLICYDLRFPEPFRPAAMQTHLYCVIANWPDKRREAWSTLLRARAIENQAYVLGVNRVGEASDHLHAGDSALADPMGKVLAQGTPYEESIVAGDVDPKEVAKVRRQLGFLKDRRPALYASLERDGS